MPYPPLNVSHKIIHLSQRAGPGEAFSSAAPEAGEESRRASRGARDVPLMEEQQEEDDTSEETAGSPTRVLFDPTQNLTGANGVTTNQSTQSDWPDPTDPPPADGEDEFVNAVVPEYEDSNEPGSAMGLPSEASVLPTGLPPVLLELRWSPPRPPTSYDGFNIYIYRDGRGRGWGGRGILLGCGSRIFMSTQLGCAQTANLSRIVNHDDCCAPLSIRERHRNRQRGREHSRVLHRADGTGNVPSPGHRGQFVWRL